MIVKMKVAIQRREQVGPTGEIAWVDEFVLQAAPQALDENVVQSAAAPIHTDRDAALLQRCQKLRRGELRTLIGVPDLRLAEAERRFQRRQAEAGFHRVGQFPTEHEAAVPVHDRHQIYAPPTIVPLMERMASSGPLVIALSNGSAGR